MKRIILVNGNQILSPTKNYYKDKCEKLLLEKQRYIRQNAELRKEVQNQYLMMSGG